MVIRDLENGEAPFLQEMLYAALAWRPGVELPPKEWVLEHPQIVVDAENPAARLYARLGYVAYEQNDGLGRMIVELT